jgi:uncharacterized membrane protein
VEVFGILIGLAVVLGIPVVAIVALARTATLERDLAALRREVAALRQAAGTAPAAPPAPAPAVAEPEPPPAAPAMASAPPVAPQPAAPPPPPQPAASQPAPPRPAPRKPAGEGAFASRWMVWVGGVALALGGVFLVNYSIEQGYLGPLVRILLGVVAGLAMLGAGEAARRHPARLGADPARLGAGAGYVPAVATGAGVLTLFASVYAAYALYALVPPLPAFLLLAGVGLAAIALSLLHGQAMALFGLAGALLVPALVATDAPSAAALFGYLAVVAVALAAIARLRGWWPTVAATVAGGGLWVALWLIGQPAAPQPPAVGLFLVLLAALPLWASRGDPARAPSPVALAPAEATVWGAAALVGLLAFMLVRYDAYGTVSVAALAGVCVVFLAGAWRVPAWYGAPAAAALAVLAALAAWHAPELIRPPGPDTPAFDVVAPPEFVRFNGVAAGFALLFGLTGFMALRQRLLAGFWAGLSAAVPVLVLLIAYWRWADFRSDAGWAAVGLAGAALATLAAERRQGSRAALGAYAAGAAAALSLALAMILREAWLTAALSLQLPALAWLSRRLDLPLLRGVALAIAGVVLARLLLNPALLSYPTGGWPILNWVLYGYGVPAAAFWWAARGFLRQRDGLVVQALEAGAVAFLTCLVSFQIRHLLHGSLGAPYTSLLETSLQTAAWLGLGYGLYVRRAFAGRRVLDGAAAVLRAVALVHLVFVQVLFQNPLSNHTPVGDLPLLNTLALAYLLPALLGALYAWSAARRGDRLTFGVAGVAALLLALLWLSLEVRRLFQGSYLDGDAVTDAERWAYTATWILYGAALFAAGLRWDAKALRAASLAVLMLAVAKAFLFDLSEIEGIFRALSFLGLGAALLGVAYLYQRFVQRPRPAETDGPG